MVDLIERELDLMARAVKASSLEGLRTRITTLFLQYIKTPAFNPEVAKYLKVSRDPHGPEVTPIGCRADVNLTSSPGPPEYRPAAEQHVPLPQL